MHKKEDDFVKSGNRSSALDDELKEIEVMNLFSCDRALAKKIIKSSKMNGQISGIKKICHDQQGNKSEHGKGKQDYGW